MQQNGWREVAGGGMNRKAAGRRLRCREAVPGGCAERLLCREVTVAGGDWWLVAVLVCWEEAVPGGGCAGRLLLLLCGATPAATAPAPSKVIRAQH